MGALRRWLDRLAESDETRLAAETREWADSIEGSVRLAEAPLRRRVKIAGVIRRITVLPMSGHESLEALVSDGELRLALADHPGLGIGMKMQARAGTGRVVGQEHRYRRIEVAPFEADGAGLARRGRVVAPDADRGHGRISSLSRREDIYAPNVFVSRQFAGVGQRV